MNKLDDIIKEKKIIDIDLAPNTDDVYSGMCLVANSEIIMLLNFDEDNGEFDGYTIVKNNDVEQYRVWEEDEYSELKNDNSEKFTATIDLSNFIDFEHSLKSLVSQFVAIFTYDDEEGYFVGKVLSVENSSVELHLVDEDFKWDEIEIIKLDDISYLGFDTEYEREIKKSLL